MKTQREENRAETRIRTGEDRASLQMFLYSLCFCLVAIGLSGCGYAIHTKASLPFDEIQIGTIENRTYEPKLQDRLNKSLTEEFLKQGISVRNNAGYKLSGVIRKFSLQVLSEKSDVAAEYEVTVIGDFKLADPKGNIKEFKDIGSPFIVSFSGAGQLNQLIANKELASERALQDMASEIVAALIYR
ncbi:MAG TPA: LPS assembly lipoprotein LptE [Thermodesulfovibrionales bacterium]|nr:LPS assembly lipoprotein LptE [Thermodesulfovibrionales bacterium]